MGGWWFFGLFWMLLLAVLIGAVVWAVARSSRSGSEPQAQQGSRAREVLDERYARGEISTEEYRERRQGLES